MPIETGAGTLQPDTPASSGVAYHIHLDGGTPDYLYPNAPTLVGVGTVARNPSSGALVANSPVTTGTARHIRFDLGAPGQLFAASPVIAGVGTVTQSGAKTGTGVLVPTSPALDGVAVHLVLDTESGIQVDAPTLIGFGYVQNSNTPYTFSGFSPFAAYSDPGQSRLTVDNQDAEILPTLGGFTGFNIGSPYGDPASIHLTFDPFPSQTVLVTAGDTLALTDVLSNQLRTILVSAFEKVNAEDEFNARVTFYTSVAERANAADGNDGWVTYNTVVNGVRVTLDSGLTFDTPSYLVDYFDAQGNFVRKADVSGSAGYYIPVSIDVQGNVYVGNNSSGVTVAISQTIRMLVKSVASISTLIPAPEPYSGLIN